MKSGPGRKSDFGGYKKTGPRGPKAEGRKTEGGPKPDPGPRPKPQTPPSLYGGGSADRWPDEEPARAPRREGPSGFRAERSDRPDRGPRRDGPGGFRSDRPDRGPRDLDSRPGRSFERGPRAEGPGFRPHLGEGELRYHGKNACVALFKNRPKDVIRVYVRKDLSAEFAGLLEFCAKHKVAYHLVPEGDLERLTDTKHHDGICLIAREKTPMIDKDLFRELGGGRNLILYLDGVGNPHNLGAILRTAAHFGVKYVAGSAEELPRISPAANRVSEGGAEHVSLVRVEEPERFLDKLKSMGFHVYGFDIGEKTISLFETRIAEKAVFVMGAEVSGLSGMMRASSDVQVKIPGTGMIDSLNVSVAAALAMAEFHRQEAAGRSVRIVKKNPKG